MSKVKLSINSAKNGFTVEGSENNYYPYDGQLFFPFNSVIVVMDESDIITFRSTTNYDVLFSGKIGYIDIDNETVTKNNIISKFSAIANQESGGGGDLDNYYTKAQTDALIPDVSNYFDGAEYDSNTKRINFKHGQTVKAYIDATAFIKDGMVSNVEITNGNLVITFNTDAGKEPITIPLTDIFNPANYYDKTTADSTFATQVVVNQEIAARIAAINGVNDALLTKADKSDTYTKTQVDSAISTAVENIDLTDYATKAELSTVATTGDYNDLSNKPTIPTVPTNVSAFTNDAGYLTQHQSLADYYTKTEVDDELATKQDASTAFSGDYDDLTNKPTIPTVPTNVSAFNNDAGYLTQHQSLAEYYTKTESDGKYVTKTEYDTDEEVISRALNKLDDDKQDKLTAGTNITIQNNVISASGGTQVQSDWNQSDTTAVDFIKNKPTIPDTSNFLTINQWNKKEVAIANALTELNEEKADVSELDGKQDVLTAGQNITIQNNVISATGGTQVQADWNQSDSSAVDFIKNKPTIPSLTDYYTKTESDGKYVTQTDFDEKEEVIATSLNGLNTAISGKQDTLVSGTSIKTINNQSLLGSGNITISGGGTQVQADWEESDTTDPSYIQNKPDLTVYAESSDLATVATSGSYNDLSNKPTIPDVSTKVTNGGNVATIMKITQNDYDALVQGGTVDNNTLYIIV